MNATKKNPSFSGSEDRINASAKLLKQFLKIFEGGSRKTR